MEYIIGIYIVIGCIMAIEGILSITPSESDNIAMVIFAARIIISWPRFWKASLTGWLILSLIDKIKGKEENQSE